MTGSVLRGEKILFQLALIPTILMYAMELILGERLKLQMVEKHGNRFIQRRLIRDGVQEALM